MRRMIPLGLTAALPLLGGCDSGTTPDPGGIPERLNSLTAPVVHAVPGYRKSVTVRVLDANGEGVEAIPVVYETADGHGTVHPVPARNGAKGVGDDGTAAANATDGPAEATLQATTGFTGRAEASWSLPEEPGTYEMVARAEAPNAGPLEGSPVEVEAVVRSFGPAVDDVLRRLPRLIEFALERMRGAVDSDSRLRNLYEERIALIQPRDFDSEVIRDRRFETTSTLGAGDREIPITAVFTADEMRAGARRVIELVAAGVPAIEIIFDVAFPRDAVRVWYGFELGSRGGGGVLYLEDRATYEARGGGIALYDGIVMHEISHTYMSHEVLTQFLELLLYNQLEGATSFNEWTYTRDYEQNPNNTGVHALLDVYRMIGHDAMIRALRAVRPMMPRYGMELTAEQKQVFVDEAEEELKEAVAEKMDAVGIA